MCLYSLVRLLCAYAHAVGSHDTNVAHVHVSGYMLGVGLLSRLCRAHPASFSWPPCRSFILSKWCYGMGARSSKADPGNSRCQHVVGVVCSCNTFSSSFSPFPLYPSPSLSPPAAVSMAKAFVDEEIKKPVVVFSKTYCPFCKMAKDTLNSTGAKFEVIELDERRGSKGVWSFADMRMCLSGMVYSWLHDV